MNAPLSKKSRPWYATPLILIATLAVLLGAGLIYDKRKNEERSDRQYAMLVASVEDAKVSKQDLSKIELFDGSAEKMRETATSHTLHNWTGRLRNRLDRPLVSVTVTVAIYQDAKKILESFDFQVPAINSIQPLKPGYAIGFEHKDYKDRIPNDASWTWGVTAAVFAPEVGSRP